MTIIDHRVLVNAPPEVVWELLGDLAALPKWHVNCQDTSILTTQRQGVGVRRRNTMSGGPDTVEEILTWYNNLGFEYTVVDGPRYRSNRGRLRLQAIPEGTVVQWTFEYQLGGALASLRDFFLRRRLNDETIRSLKRFKQLVESTGIRMDAATVERVSMRPAPNATERAAIGEATTRVRSARVEAPPTPVVVPEDTQVSLPPAPPPDLTAWQAQPAVLDIGADDLPSLDGIIVEPPLAEEDTRPRPPIEAASESSAPYPQPEVPPPAAEPEPSDVVNQEFMVPTPVSDGGADDTVPVAPPVEDFGKLSEKPQVEPAEPPYTAPMNLAGEAEPERTLEEPEPLPETPAQVNQAEPTLAEEPTTWPEPALQPVEEPESSPILEESPAPGPESEPVGPSIWEVFGITPPSSQTQASMPQAAMPQAPMPSGDEPERTRAASGFESSPAKTGGGFHRRARRGNIIRVRFVLRANGLRARLALLQARRLSRR